jgi:hypothetical protein
VTLDEAAAQVVSLSGVDSATAQQRVLDRYRELVVQARWFVRDVSAGTTTAGTQEYALPASVAQIDLVRVGTGRFDGVPDRTLTDVADGRAVVSGDTTGIFSAGNLSTGLLAVRLFPVPTTTGLAITVRGALFPPAMIGTDSFIVPVDTHPWIVDAAAGTGLAREDEASADAQAAEGLWQQRIAQLASRRTGLAARGPFRIQVAGLDY